MVALFVMIVTNAFADFIWEPLTIGYDNIFCSTDITGENKVSCSLNQLKFMPLLAGLGYMPKDKGFYFMWENTLGIGKPKFKFYDVTEKGEVGASFASAFLFGYAFVPIQDLYLSFSSGVAFGTFFIDDVVGIFAGLPFDLSMRYFFNKHLGVLCGVQDTVIFSSLAVYGFSISGNTKVGNKFAIKVGLTTRW